MAGDIIRRIEHQPETEWKCLIAPGNRAALVDEDCIAVDHIRIIVIRKKSADFEQCSLLQQVI